MLAITIAFAVFVLLSLFSDLSEKLPGQQEKPAYERIYNRFFKRVFDLLLGGIGMIILSPFYLLVALAIALEDGFPVLYRPRRGGPNGSFRIANVGQILPIKNLAIKSVNTRQYAA